MAKSKLREKYGGKTGEAINRAIRAECPGGDEAIATMTLARQMCQRHGYEDSRGQPSALAALLGQIMGIVDAMEDEIRRRYDMQPREERDDFARRDSHRRAGSKRLHN